MARKAILDTDTLLDACMSGRPDWAYVDLLLDDIASGELDACIAATSLKEACTVLTERIGEKAARELAAASINAFSIIEVGAATFRIALESDEPNFADAVVRACAESAHVDFIISRNESAFGKSHIKRLSARDYVELFSSSDTM